MRSGHPILKLTSGACERPTRVDLSTTSVSEDFLQALLDESPELVELDELGLSGALISLGREIPTGAGPVDNAFVTARGELVIVEAKLWRNPEARRKVVAQALDYAAALRGMSYESFESACSSKLAGRSLAAHVGVDGGPNEAAFIDEVTQRLKDARFHLLIVGDGIRTELESLAGLLADHPQSRFTLRLVELGLFRLEDERLLVVPTVIGRSSEVVRAVVEVSEGAEVHISLPPEPITSSVENHDLDSFLAECDDRSGPGWSTFAADLFSWWEAQPGRFVKFNPQSIALGVAHPGGSHTLFALIYTYALELKNVDLAAAGVIDGEEWTTRLRERGFTGAQRMMLRPEGLTHVAPDLLRTTLDELVAAQSAALTER